MARKRGRAAQRTRPRLPRTLLDVVPAVHPDSAEERQRIARAWVEHHEREYRDRTWVSEGEQQFGNPLHAWRAYGECRAHGLAIPDWVLAYFDRTADRFWRLTMASSRPVGDLSPLIAEAVEMKRPGRGGSGSVCTQYDRTNEILLAINAANEIAGRSNGKLKVALRRVARQRGVSLSTVERAFKAFRRDLEADGYRFKK
jgi:hypothetical protein